MEWEGAIGVTKTFLSLRSCQPLKLKYLPTSTLDFFFKANCIKIKSLPILIAIVSMNIGREEYSSFRGGERLVTEQIRNKKKDYIGGKVRS